MNTEQWVKVNMNYIVSSYLVLTLFSAIKCSTSEKENVITRNPYVNRHVINSGQSALSACEMSEQRFSGGTTHEDAKCTTQTESSLLLENATGVLIGPQEDCQGEPMKYLSTNLSEQFIRIYISYKFIY